jgi:hypothetical protein
VPKARLIGNAVLSFMTKPRPATGMFFDPTMAIPRSAEVFREVPLAKLSRRYFFESDFLFRLHFACCCSDVPMDAVYATERVTSDPVCIRFVLTWPCQNSAETTLTTT